MYLTLNVFSWFIIRLMIITHPSGVRITQDHLTKSPSETNGVGREVKGSSLFIINLLICLWGSRISFKRSQVSLSRQRKTNPSIGS